MPDIPPFVLDEDPERVNDTQTALITGVVASLHLVALVIFATRSFIRLVVLKSPGIQDAFMGIATIAALAGTIVLFLQVPYGLGRHVDTVPRSSIVTFGKYSFIHTVASLLCGIGFLKLAIALELMKYNGRLWRWYNVALWCLIVFVVLYTLEALLSFILFCQPVAKQWDQSIGGSCYSVSMFIKFGLANTGFNIFTDIAFATLPVPLVWSLKIPVKTRVYLVIVLSFGYVAVAMGVVKAISQINFNPSGDVTYGYDVQFWGLLQLNIGIIAACAPSLKPLFKKILRLESLTSHYGYNKSDRHKARSTLFSNGVPASHGYSKQSSRTDQFHEEFEMRVGHHDKVRHAAHTVALEDKRGDSSSGHFSSQGAKYSVRESGSQEAILQPENSNRTKRPTEIKITG